MFVGHQVHADEVAAYGGGGGEREGAGQWRRREGLAVPAERDVRPPLAWSGDTSRCADDAPAGHDDADVPAERRDELLRECAVFAEPAAERRALEGGVEVGRRPAEDDVAAPAPEARLEDEWQLGCG